MAKYRVQLLNNRGDLAISRDIEAKDPQSAIKQIISCDVAPTKSQVSANARVELIDGSKQSIGYYIYTPKTYSSDIRLWVVTACREPYSDDCAGGVELAGVFSNEHKAHQAVEIVKKWLNKEGYTDGEVFCLPTSIDQLSWYDINKTL